MFSQFTAFFEWKKIKHKRKIKKTEWTNKDKLRKWLRGNINKYWKGECKRKRDKVVKCAKKYVSMSMLWKQDRDDREKNGYRECVLCLCVCVCVRKREREREKEKEREI